MRGGKRVGSGRKPDPSKIGDDNHTKKCPECQGDVPKRNAKFCCKPCSATFYGRRRKEELRESRPDCQFCRKKCDRPDQKFCSSRCFYDSVKSQTPELKEVICDNCSTPFGRAKWTPQVSTCQNCRYDRRKTLNSSQARAKYANLSQEEREDLLAITNARRSKQMRLMPNYFKRIVMGAKSRGCSVQITTSDIIVQLIRQNGICALSGRKISLLDNSASLDRINSDIGYTKDNIQWLYKPINTMKMSLPQADFLQLCREIATRHP